MPPKKATRASKNAKTGTKTPTSKAKASAGRARKSPKGLGPMCTSAENTRRVLALSSQTPKRNSPLPGSFTTQERRDWIQRYINSVQPSVIRVDYEKTPQKNIIKQLPRNSIAMPMTEEDKKLRMLLDKYTLSPQKTIVMRVDYDKENGNSASDRPATPAPSNSDDELPLLLNADINQTVSYEEFYRKSLAERSSPQPSTSKGGVLENIPENNESATETVVEKDSSLIILDSPFVTQRTPAKVRAPKPVDDDVVEVPVVPVQHPVIDISDESDLDHDQSVQIVTAIQTPAVTTRNLRPRKEKFPVPKLEPTEAAAAGASDTGFGDCPICFEILGPKGISSTLCGHIFCTECIKSAVKSSRKCPKCRTALTLKKIHPLYL